MNLFCFDCFFAAAAAAAAVGTAFVGRQFDTRGRREKLRRKIATE